MDVHNEIVIEENESEAREQEKLNKRVRFYKDTMKLIKMKMNKADALIRQYNDKMKECDLLSAQLSSLKNEKQDILKKYNLTMEKMSKLELMNMDYKESFEKCKNVIDKQKIKLDENEKHINQLVCKIKNTEEQNTTAEEKIKILEQEIKCCKIAIKAFEKKCNIQKTMQECQTISLPKQDISVLTDPVIIVPHKVKMKDVNVMTDEYLNIQKEPFPIFCTKCEVRISPTPIDQILKIMSSSPPLLSDNLSPPNSPNLIEKTIAINEMFEINSTSIQNDNNEDISNLPQNTESQNIMPSTEKSSQLSFMELDKLTKKINKLEHIIKKSRIKKKKKNSFNHTCCSSKNIKFVLQLPNQEKFFKFPKSEKHKMNKLFIQKKKKNTESKRNLNNSDWLIEDYPKPRKRKIVPCIEENLPNKKTKYKNKEEDLFSSHEVVVPKKILNNDFDLNYSNLKDNLSPLKFSDSISPSSGITEEDSNEIENSTTSQPLMCENIYQTKTEKINLPKEKFIIDKINKNDCDIDKYSLHVGIDTHEESKSLLATNKNKFNSLIIETSTDKINNDNTFVEKYNITNNEIGKINKNHTLLETPFISNIMTDIIVEPMHNYNHQIIENKNSRQDKHSIRFEKCKKDNLTNMFINETVNQKRNDVLYDQKNEESTIMLNESNKLSIDSQKNISVANNDLINQESIDTCSENDILLNKISISDFFLNKNYLFINQNVNNDIVDKKNKCEDNSIFHEKKFISNGLVEKSDLKIVATEIRNIQEGEEVSQINMKFTNTENDKNVSQTNIEDIKIQEAEEVNETNVKFKNTENGRNVSQINTNDIKIQKDENKINIEFANIENGKKDVSQTTIEDIKINMEFTNIETGRDISQINIDDIKIQENEEVRQTNIEFANINNGNNVSQTNIEDIKINVEFTSNENGRDVSQINIEDLTIQEDEETNQININDTNIQKIKKGNQINMYEDKEINRTNKEFINIENDKDISQINIENTNVYEDEEVSQTNIQLINIKDSVHISQTKIDDTCIKNNEEKIQTNIKNGIDISQTNINDTNIQKDAEGQIKIQFINIKNSKDVIQTKTENTNNQEKKINLTNMQFANIENDNNFCQTNIKNTNSFESEETNEMNIQFANIREDIIKYVSETNIEETNILENEKNHQTNIPLSFKNKKSKNLYTTHVTRKKKNKDVTVNTSNKTEKNTAIIEETNNTFGNRVNDLKQNESISLIEPFNFIVPSNLEDNACSNITSDVNFKEEPIDEYNMKLRCTRTRNQLQAVGNRKKLLSKIRNIKKNSTKLEILNKPESLYKEKFLLNSFLESHNTSEILAPLSKGSPACVDSADIALSASAVQAKLRIAHTPKHYNFYKKSNIHDQKTKKIDKTKSTEVFKNKTKEVNDKVSSIIEELNKNFNGKVKSDPGYFSTIIKKNILTNDKSIKSEMKNISQIITNNIDSINTAELNIDSPKKNLRKFRTNITTKMNAVHKDDTSSIDSINIKMTSERTQTLTKTDSLNSWQGTSPVRALRSRQIIIQNEYNAEKIIRRKLLQHVKLIDSTNSSLKNSSIVACLNDCLSNPKEMNRFYKKPFNILQFREDEKCIMNEIRRLVNVEEWTTKIHFEIVEKLINLFDLQLVAFFIIEYASDCITELQVFDKSHTPPAPIMTKTEQKLVTLILEIDKKCPEFCESIIQGIQFKLYKFYTSKQIQTVERLFRIAVVLNKIKKDREKVRIFCCDALYCLNFRAIDIIYVALTCWPEILPKYDSNNDIIVKTIVHIIMTLKVESLCPRLNSLRKLLFSYYNYPSSGYTPDSIRAELLRKLRENTPGINTAILLLCKKMEPEWTIHNIVKELKQIIVTRTDSSLYDVLTLLGCILRSIPINSNFKEIYEIIDQLCDVLIKSTGADELQESIVSCLISISKFNFNRVARCVLMWQFNKEFSPSIRFKLITFFKSHDCKWWWSFIKENFPPPKKGQL